MKRGVCWMCERELGVGRSARVYQRAVANVMYVLLHASWSKFMFIAFPPSRPAPCTPKLTLRVALAVPFKKLYGGQSEQRNLTARGMSEDCWRSEG